jgi:hypothetical protein
MPGDLSDLRRQLADVTAELASMPPHLIGTEKHRGRVEECRWLCRARSTGPRAAIRPTTEGRQEARSEMRRRASQPRRRNDRASMLQSTFTRPAVRGRGFTISGLHHE